MALFTAIQLSAMPVSQGLQARRTRSNGSTALTRATANSGRQCSRVLSVARRAIDATRSGSIRGTGKRFLERAWYRQWRCR